MLKYTNDLGRIIYTARQRDKSYIGILEEIQYAYNDTIHEDTALRWGARYAEDNQLPWPINPNLTRKPRNLRQNVSSDCPPRIAGDPPRGFSGENDQTHANRKYEAYLLDKLRANGKLVGVAINDLHVPYHDPKAIELACKIISTLDVDFMPGGSDAFDLPSMGKFDVPVEEMSSDYLLDAMSKYGKIVGMFRGAAPRAEMCYLMGNHDWRIHTWLNSVGAPVRHFVEHSFIKYVREDLGMYWGGWDFDSLSIGDYVLHMHGRKYGKFAAKHTYMTYGIGYLGVVCGHGHRPQEYNDTARFDGKQKKVTSVMTGCMCDLTPHYLKGNLPTGWKHGIAVYAIDDRRKQVNIENIKFDIDENGYNAVFGGRLFTVDN